VQFNFVLNLSSLNLKISTPKIYLYILKFDIRVHNIKTDNSPFEWVEEFKHLGTNLTNQNSIQEEIKSRMTSGNACYHLVQNRLSSSLLSKNLKIIYRIIILPVILYE